MGAVTNSKDTCPLALNVCYAISDKNKQIKPKFTFTLQMAENTCLKYHTVSKICSV